MGTELYRKGDEIHYQDRDNNQWGPWEILDVNGGTIRVRVEGLLDCELEVSALGNAAAKDEDRG
jgi:hypothetical protein